MAQFKIQYKCPISMSWKDIQKRYSERHEALESGKRNKPGCDLRLVEINEQGRKFTTEFQASVV